MPIAAILFTIRREVRNGWSSLSSFMTQAPLQVINLPLHVSNILLMRDVAFTLRLTLTGVGRMHTSLLVLLFKIMKVVLTLRPRRFCMV